MLQCNWETIMPKRKRNKKWIHRLIFLVLLIAAGVICFLVWDNYFNDQKDDERTETETSEQVEDEVIVEDDEVIKGDDKKVEQYDGEDPNEAEELSGVVTYARVVDNKVMIRVNIDQYLSGGSCKLDLMSGGTVVYQDVANIVNSASTATCEGFDFSLSELSSGTYEIIIKVETSDKMGTIRGNLEI